jgi:hypothetical protein
MRPVAELDGRQLSQLELVYAQAFPARLRVFARDRGSRVDNDEQ